MHASILIIDDAMLMRAILRNILTTAGYTICGEASNGVEGIKEYIKKRPDLVTLDITLQGISGIDTLKEIMRIDPNAKVIMCSAMGQQHFILEALRNGAKDFIVKPFNEGRVLSSVRRIIQL